MQKNKFKGVILETFSAEHQRLRKGFLCYVSGKRVFIFSLNSSAMAAAAIARRTPSLRLPLRLSISSSPSSPSTSSPLPSRSPISRFQRPVRRELLVLSSILPIHSAIATARLVSKLTSDSNACIQGRFANYLSPI